MIRIDHIGVPARARLDAAGFLTRIFDLDREIPDDGRFAPVRVSSEFTVDFFDSPQIEPMHVAFVTDDITFDRILEQLRSQGIPYGSQPNDPANNRLDHPLAERGLYFRTPDGHLFEVMASTSGTEGT
jgi:catechol 2,3-dioxygenase-like lactoylglutathione lyase family enzyme